MDWLKSEWLKLTLGLIYAILTAAVLMAMGSIADKINSKADKKELKQEIELVKKDIITSDQIQVRIKSAVNTGITEHEKVDAARYQGISDMFGLIMDEITEQRGDIKDLIKNQK